MRTKVLAVESLFGGKFAKPTPPPVELVDEFAVGAVKYALRIGVSLEHACEGAGITVDEYNAAATADAEDNAAMVEYYKSRGLTEAQARAAAAE